MRLNWMILLTLDHVVLKLAVLTVTLHWHYWRSHDEVLIQMKRGCVSHLWWCWECYRRSRRSHTALRTDWGHFRWVPPAGSLWSSSAPPQTDPEPRNPAAGALLQTHEGKDNTWHWIWECMTHTCATLDHRNSHGGQCCIHHLKARYLEWNRSAIIQTKIHFYL